MKNIEIEIQANIEKSKPLIDFLKKKAKFTGETVQIDEYFTPAHKNYLDTKPIEEWLRIRIEDKKYLVTYKKFYYDSEKGTYADEYETPIKNVDAICSIFGALNMRSLVKVDKKRRIYIYKDYEIALDQVEGLGDFVEIEFKGESDKSPKEIKQEMINFLKKIGVGKITKNSNGYPYIMLFPDEIKYEEL